MKNLAEDLNREGIGLSLVNVKAPVNETLQASDFIDLLSLKKIANSKSEAITLLFNKIDHDYCRKKCPYKVFWECETIK